MDGWTDVHAVMYIARPLTLRTSQSDYATLNQNILNFDYPHTFLKMRRGYFICLCPSVCPLCYLLLNRWTKFHKIWCVSYTHELGVQQQMLVRGQKVNYLISITVNFKDFYTKLYVYSHK